MTYARRAYAALQRNPGATIGYLIAAVVVLAVAVRGEDTRRIVTDSPCANEASAECQDIKKRSDEERSVPSTCVLFYKVDKGGKLLRLTKCEVKRPAGAKGGLEPRQVAASDGSGDRAPVAERHSTRSPPSGSEDAGTGGHSEGHQPGLEPGAQSPKASAEADSAPPSRDIATDTGRDRSPPSSGSSEAPKPNPITEGVGSAVEDFGEVVRETVNEAVEGVAGKACGLAGAACP